MPIAQLIGTLIGESGKEKMSQEQLNMLRDALARIRNLPLPVQQQMIAEQLGTPQASQADPEALAAQRAALARMGRYAEGGVTPEDRAQLALAEGEAARQGQIQQNSLRQSMQARGVGGSGAELALREQAAQGATENAYKAALQNMLANRQRAFQATAAQGQMGSVMQNEAYKRKAAADAVAKYNAMSRQAAQAHNIGLPQTQFENAMNRARAAAGQTGPLASAVGAEGSGQANFWTNMGAAGQKYLDGQSSESSPTPTSPDLTDDEKLKRAFDIASTEPNYGSN